MVKVGRNDKCVCGSGKKYKKCCMNVLNVNTHHIIFPNESVPNNDKVMWRTSYKDLKNKEVVEKINKFVNETQLYSNSCHYVSNLLSVEVDGVDVVKGWYGFKEKDMETFLMCIKNDVENFNIKLKKINEKWSSLTNVDGDVVYCDYENYTFYYGHSWNKCGEQYFDLTTELNPKNDTRWVYYMKDVVKDMTPYRLNKISSSLIKNECLTLMYNKGLSLHLPHNKLNNVRG